MSIGVRRGVACVRGSEGEWGLWGCGGRLGGVRREGCVPGALVGRLLLALDFRPDFRWSIAGLPAGNPCWKAQPECSAGECRGKPFIPFHVPSGLAVLEVRPPRHSPSLLGLLPRVLVGQQQVFGWLSDMRMGSWLDDLNPGRQGALGWALLMS